MSGINLMVLGSGAAVPLPENTSLPVISGNPNVGHQLSLTSGTWINPVDDYTYIFEREVSAGSYTVMQASSGVSTYTVQNADAGFQIRGRVTATNSTGNVNAHTANLGVVAGQAVFYGNQGTANTSWTVPFGVSQVSVVCVGCGGSTISITNSVTPGHGGGGGALCYANNLNVTGGNTVTMYWNATAHRTGQKRANFNWQCYAETGAVGGYNSDGGLAAYSGGGTAYNGANGTSHNGAGGGAGGYSGNGGAASVNTYSAGSDGSGGGGGGAGGTGAFSNGCGGSGGGVGLLGEGSNGAGGSGGGGGGGGGSGGGAGGTANNNPGGSSAGGSVGGGGGGAGARYHYDPSPGAIGGGGTGGIRVIWGTAVGGAARAYPSTNTGNL